MAKIIVIGQAPPDVNQAYPYSTTMFYSWLAEVGISVKDAQEMFEFEAVYNKFPGYNLNGKGHKKPTKEQMDEYWPILSQKIQASRKIIILGNVAKNYLQSTAFWESRTQPKLYMIHPSKLNYNLFQKNKDKIIKQLHEFTR